MTMPHGITARPEVRHGEPCFTGTRVPVSLPKGFLENGGTVEEALAEFPELDKEDLEAARTWPANLGGTQVEYDRVADVLYISLGDPVPAYCHEDSEVEGLHLRYAFADDHLCGATIVWYSAQDLATLKAKVPFAVDWPDAERKDYPPPLTTEQTVNRLADDVRGYLKLHPDAKVAWVWRFGHDVGRDGDGKRTDVMNGTATFTLKVNGGVVDNGLTEEEKATLDAIEADPASFEPEVDEA